MHVHLLLLVDNWNSCVSIKGPQGQKWPKLPITDDINTSPTAAKVVISLRSFLSHVVSWPGVSSKPPRAPLVWPADLRKILYLCISHFPSPRGFSLLISTKYIKRKINVGDLLEDSRSCGRLSPGNPNTKPADAKRRKSLTVNPRFFFHSFLH